MQTEDMPHPPPFLKVVVSDFASDPTLTGLCAEFESGQWRADRLAEHMMNWLPEFALTWSEYRELRGENLVEAMRRAARNVYTSEKYGKRGEFGELLLHLVVRQVFKTIPAISKLYYKDGPNDTVKGFDAVHVVSASDRLELWLGEAKFYDDVGDAIASVVTSLEAHLKRDYFRAEAAAIVNKIDPKWPHADRLKLLLHENTSLDKVFDAASIPVLLTYDSPTLNVNKACCKACEAAFVKELKTHHATFCAKKPTLPVRVHLLLVPLQSKARLVSLLHERLQAWQRI